MFHNDGGYIQHLAVADNPVIIRDASVLIYVLRLIPHTDYKSSVLKSKARQLIQNTPGQILALLGIFRIVCTYFGHHSLHAAGCGLLIVYVAGRIQMNAHQNICFQLTGIFYTFIDGGSALRVPGQIYPDVTIALQLFLQILRNFHGQLFFPVHNAVPGLISSRRIRPMARINDNDRFLIPLFQKTDSFICLIRFLHGIADGRGILLRIADNVIGIILFGEDDSFLPVQGLKFRPEGTAIQSALHTDQLGGI